MCLAWALASDWLLLHLVNKLLRVLICLGLHVVCKDYQAYYPGARAICDPQMLYKILLNLISSFKDIFITCLPPSANEIILVIKCHRYSIIPDNSQFLILTIVMCVCIARESNFGNVIWSHEVLHSLYQTFWAYNKTNSIFIMSALEMKYVIHVQVVLWWRN